MFALIGTDKFLCVRLEVVNALLTIPFGDSFISAHTVISSIGLILSIVRLLHE
jgi:hypothetical protein